MSDEKCPPKSFWREALRLSWSFLKEEWQWVVIFAALWAIEERLVFQLDDSKKVSEELRRISGDLVQAAEFIRTTGDIRNILYSSGLNLVTTTIMSFIFTVVMLRRYFGATALEMTPSRFLKWFKAIACKYALLLAPFVICVGVVSVLPKEAATNNWIRSAFVLWFFFMMLYYFIGLLVFLLVSPLALLDKDKPLRTSLALTRNNLFDIWWGAMVVMGVVFLVISAISVVAVPSLSLISGIQETSQLKESQGYLMVLALIAGTGEAILGGAMAAYMCVVYRDLAEGTKA